MRRVMRALLSISLGSIGSCQAPRIDVIVECLSSAECSAGAVCRNGACLQCSEDTDCDGARHCNAGRCVECTQPEHCGGDALCMGGTCYYTLSPLNCSPGAQRCQGRSLEVCSDDGGTWLPREECPSAPLCQAASEGRRRCLEPSCSTGALSCSGSELRRCNADRTGWDAVATCETSAHCDPAAVSCRDDPCEAGQLRCNIGGLERCNELQTSWEPIDVCASQELCELGRAAADAASGQPHCAQPGCDLDEWRCSGDQLQTCNEGQTGWELAETCSTAALCEAGLKMIDIPSHRACARATCVVGEHRCSETGVLEVCTAERDGFIAVQPCIGPAFCNAVAANEGLSGCLDAPCQRGEMLCNGNRVERCSDDQTQFELVGEPCDTRDLCIDDDSGNAFCEEPTCRRGLGSDSEFVCDGSSLFRCNEQHTGYDLFNDCGRVDLCTPRGCENAICSAGERRCNGSIAERCNDAQTGFEVSDQCASDALCDGATGTCREPVDAGAPDAGSVSGGSVSDGGQ